MLDHTILCGDCREVLRTLDAESVDCCITSPPYWGLRDYGVEGQLGLEATPEEFVANLVGVFREVRRVLKPSGCAFVNLGDSYAGSANNKPHTGNAGVVGSAGKCLTSNTTVPPGLKPKDLCMIPARVALALQADGWWLRNDICWCKCLSGGTTVYARTQKGDMPTTIKDLVRLDPATVQLWDGEKWNQVVAWEEVAPKPGRGDRDRERRRLRRNGKEPTVEGEFELEFRNGERIGCTCEHKWPTQRGLVRADALRIGDRVQTTRLPAPSAPVAPVALDGALIGWFCGLYLAEGSMSGNAIQIAAHSDEREEWGAKLQAVCDAYHGSLVSHQYDGDGMSFVLHGPILNGILSAYIAGRVAMDKHLHPRCWERSDEFLRALLQGYLDGDGHRGASSGQWRLGFTSNDQLARDLRVMAARLGASLRLRRGTATNTASGKTHPCWRGSLVFDLSRRRTDDGEVVAIRQSRARTFWSISLRDEPHVFALASGLLTGNSNAMPESVTDRFSSKHEHVFLLTRAARYWFDLPAVAAKYGDAGATTETVLEGSLPFAVGLPYKLLAAVVASESAAGRTVLRLAESGELHPAGGASSDLTTRGRGRDLGKAQVAVHGAVTWQAEDLEVLGPIRFVGVIEEPEGASVVYMEDGVVLGNSAPLTAVCGALQCGRDNDLLPVWATILDAPSSPSGAGRAVSVLAAPSAIASLVAEVVVPDGRTVSPDIGPAVVTLHFDGPGAVSWLGAPTVDVAGTLHRLIIPVGASPVNHKNPGDVWTIPTQPTPYAHFATMPLALVERCLLAGCPPQVCAECGLAWEHRVERTDEPDASAKGSRFDRGKTAARDGGDRTQAGERTTLRDLGYRPACECGGVTVPGVVLDPFAGSGTTTQAARKHGRRSIGIELNQEYEAVQRQRLGCAGLLSDVEFGGPDA